MARTVPGSEVCTARSVLNHLSVTAAQDDAKDKANLGYKASSKLKEVWGEGI